MAFALQSQGWYLRQDIIWQKPNPMPESVRDRCTKAHEYLFLLSKSPRYYFDSDAIKVPKTSGDGTKNRRSVWNIPTYSIKGAHFATFPPDLVKPCIVAGCPKGGVVLDPFIGSGTTAIVAKSLGRSSIGIDLNSEYLDLARTLLKGD
jgi:site-specific DNA-methyltransferase (adenine-specific)